MNIGTNIKVARKKRGITQTELAEKVGVTQTMINFIEKGIRMPSVNVLIAISKELDVSMDYLTATA